MANNKEIAHQILTAVGGASNLKDATHDPSTALPEGRLHP